MGGFILCIFLVVASLSLGLCMTFQAIRHIVMQSKEWKPFAVVAIVCLCFYSVEMVLLGGAIAFGSV